MSKKIIPSDNKRNLSLTCSAEIIAIDVDLLTEILLRVPAKSLIRFKSVSKQWLCQISDARFCRNHTKQNPSPPISGLYFYTNWYKPDRPLPLEDQITAVSVCDHPATTLPSFSFMEDSGLGSALTVLHSSNGLMLCTTSFYYSYVVCNLTTQKFMVLPKLALVSKWYHRSRYYCLIYHPKKSPHYKVVVASFSFDSDTSQFDVYSSESGYWKSTVASTPRIPNPWLVYRAVWNGAIFWMSCGPGAPSCSEHDHFFVQFDVDAERPTTTGVPSPGYRLNGILYFGECGGPLLLIQFPCRNATEFRVLEMMDGENKFRWTVKHRVGLQPLTLPQRSTCKFLVISVMNVGANEDDLAVVLYVPRKVVQYNIKCKTLKVLCDLAGSDFSTCVPRPSMHSYRFIESLMPV